MLLQIKIKANEEDFSHILWSLDHCLLIIFQILYGKKKGKVKKSCNKHRRIIKLYSYTLLLMAVVVMVV